MKRIYTLVFSAIALLASFGASAQSFTVAHDTVYFTYTGTSVVSSPDYVAVPSGGSNVTLKWDVVNTNFPSDWRSAVTGICDNNLCYSGSAFWTALTTMRTSLPYSAGSSTGDFHMQLGLSSATSYGTYYLTARLSNASASTDTALATWIITYNPTAVPNVNKGSEEVSLYPNPATSEINLVFDANADVKTAAVYNIIGKVMSVYRISGNSANLNLENIPTGIYFVRLMNTQGDVVATRKFTKQ